MPVIDITREMLSRYAWSLGERFTYTACKAFWQNKSNAKRQSVTVGEAGSEFELRRVYPDEALALRAALAKLEELKRGRASLSGTLAVAQPDATSESPIELTGILPKIDGRWIARHVTHHLNNDGLTTRFRAEIPQGETRLNPSENAS
jgi:phage protein D